MTAGVLVGQMNAHKLQKEWPRQVKQQSQNNHCMSCVMCSEPLAFLFQAYLHASASGVHGYPWTSRDSLQSMDCKDIHRILDTYPWIVLWNPWISTACMESMDIMASMHVHGIHGVHDVMLSIHIHEIHGFLGIY